MRVLVIAASTDGYRSPSDNDRRTAALRDAIDRAPGSTELVVAPAGYWTAPHESALPALLASLTSALSPLLSRRSIALLAGIDALPVPRSAHLPGLIRRHQLPFFGFALDGTALVGPWRQLSTTQATAGLAPAAALDDVIDRVLEIGGRPLLPLLCGEMFSRPLRDRAASAGASLVPVIGHAGLGQGLVPTLASLHAATRAPVLHTQHLSPTSTGRHHWLDTSGAPHHAALSPMTDSDHPNFWLSARSIAI